MSNYDNIYLLQKFDKIEKAHNIMEDELKIAYSQFGNQPLSDNARQALNNQAMLVFLKSVYSQFDGSSDEYMAKQIFSGDDR